MQVKMDGDSDTHNPMAREADRLRLAEDLEAFRRDGGRVCEVVAGERADPPERPESNYGRGAI